MVVPMPEIKRPLVSALVAGVAMSLGACTNEPAPIVTATPTPTVESPAPSPTPSVTPDGELTREQLLEILPPEAHGDDVDAAVAVARFFLGLRSQMLTDSTASVSAWLSLSTENCAFCSSTLDTVTTRRAEGQKTSGGEIVFDERPFFSDYGDSVTEAYVREMAVEREWATADASGATLNEGGPTPVQFDVRLALVDGIWRVDGVAVTAQ